MPTDFTIDGDKLAQDILDKIGTQAQAPQPVMTKALKLVQAGIRKNIGSRGGYYGTSWPALAASTVERKTRQGYRTNPLIAKGVLLGSLAGSNKASIFKVAKTVARTGTKDYLARFHQGGTDGGKTKIPARPLLDIKKDDRSKIFEMIREHLLA